jgi:hypothetical protein
MAAPLRLALLLLAPGTACGWVPLSAYDVRWEDAAYAGAEFGTASMPVGNGDAAANVWWHEGALYALLAKGDAWSAWHDLLKVGRVRISLQPPPSEANYSLTMHVANASVELRMEGMRALLWVDAHVNALRIEVESTQPSTLSVELQRWRNESRPWGDSEQGYQFFCDWSNRTTMPPDVVVAPSQPGDSELLWFHRNTESSWKADVTHQGLGHALHLGRDPFMNRTFGALVAGDSDQRRLLSSTRGAHRLSSPAAATRHTVSAYYLTQQTDTPAEWIANARAFAKAGDLPTVAAWDTARDATAANWSAFWNRSRLDISTGGQHNATPGRRQGPQPGQSVSWYPARDLSHGAQDPAQRWTWTGTHERGRIRSGANASLCLSSRPPSNSLAMRGSGGSSLAATLSGSTEHAVSVAVCDAKDTMQSWAFYSGNGTILSLGTPHTGCDGGVPGHGCCLSVRGGSTAAGAAADLYGCACSSPACPGWPSSPDKNQQFTLAPETIVNAIAGFYLTAGAAAAPSPAPVVAFELARRWHLQRMIHGMLGRGQYPIKFNGNLFTVGQPTDIWSGPDFRLYGGFYWHQNTRQTYWSMLGSGDFDLMAPFFNFYTDALDLAVERTRKYWGHGGAVFAETIGLSGLHAVYWYGCEKRFEESWPAGEGGFRPDWYISCAYLRYHYNSGLEVTAAMLEYYRATGSAAFANATLLPFAHEVVNFYYSHFQDWEGKWVITPAQSLETWQETVNPAEQIAGLQAVLLGLDALPTALVPADSQERALWASLQAVLPPLPMGAESCGANAPSDSPAAGGGGGADGKPPHLSYAEYYSRQSNTENPELYAVFPYKLFTVASNESELAIARETYSRRLFHGDTSEWQDCLQSALLGMVEETQRLVIGRLDRGSAMLRFPGFYGPMADDNWVPDEGHASILKTTLQFMLVAADSATGRIFLFPSWPREWDADFKLHAEGAVIEAACESGVLTKLVVTPPERRVDIVFAQQDYCRP